MGRWSTYPTTTDSLRSFDLPFLKKYGYIKPNHNQSGTITWTSNGGTKNSISVWVNTKESTGFCRIDYTLNETEKVSYTVDLVTRPSNLGKGLIWYFVCPVTFRHCRKLYLYGGKFVSRFAFRLMYKLQLESKTGRLFVRSGKMHRSEPYSEMYGKHFKRYYNGKPTKRYLKLLKVIDEEKRLDKILFSYVSGKLAKVETKIQDRKKK